MTRQRLHSKAQSVDSQTMAPTNRPVITPRFRVAVLLAVVVEIEKFFALPSHA